MTHNAELRQEEPRSNYDADESDLTAPDLERYRS